MIPGVSFTKMSGAGNDFLVFDERDVSVLRGTPAEWAPRICERRLSVGSDGVVLVGRAEGGDLRVRFFNPDGSEAFCGNGTRCAVRFAVLRQMVTEPVRVETVAGVISARTDGARVVLDLGAPRQLSSFRTRIGDAHVEGMLVDAGCPHAVIVVDDVARAPLERWGPALRRHADFGPDGANVDVVADDGCERVRVRTWERGVEGETLCCGSGALAAALARRSGPGLQRLTVLPASRIPLTIELDGPRAQPDRAAMTGDARVIFEGRLGDEAWIDQS